MLTDQAILSHIERQPHRSAGFKQLVREMGRTYLERLEYRVRYYRFFFIPPLYLALVAFLPCLRQFRFAWVAATVTLFSLGPNFFPAFQVLSVPACSCLFLLMSVAGREWLTGLTFGCRAAGTE